MRIKKNDVPKIVQDLFVIPNPKIVELKRAGQSTRWCKKTISLVYNDLLLPGSAYWSARAKKPLRLDEVCVGAFEIEKGIQLRSYQKKPLELMLGGRCCLLEASTGFGKTVLACKLIEQLQLKTLIVCHSVVLVRQFQEEIKKFLNIDSGVWYGVKKELKDITVTTYRSAILNKEMFHKHGFEMLIVDEADLFVTDNYLRFLCETPAKKVYGFTATPEIEKYDDLLKPPYFMERIWGKIFKAETDKQTEILKEIHVHKYKKTYYDEGIYVPAKEWHLFRRLLDDDLDRKREQCEWIVENVNQGDHGLVLLDRVLDVEQYAQKLESIINIPVYHVHGSTKKKDREFAINEFKETGGIMIANYKILSRGYDNQKANKLFICFPMQSITSARQGIGRILRTYLDKEAVVFDWVDSSLSFQFEKRKKTYLTFFPNAKIFE